MSERYSAGVATAYGAALRGGYTGTYNDFCTDIAKLGNITEELDNISATATTLEAGSSATASYNDSVFSFGIPKGDTGAQGERGETGAKGDKGDTGETGATGATGNGIASIAKTATVGLVDTYTITFTDGTTTTFDVTNGAEAIDTTLSIAGRAADAKAVGDKIADVKSDLNDISDALSYSVVEDIFNSLTFTSGYMSKQGAIYSASTLQYSNKIPVKTGDVLSFFSTSSTNFRFVTAFNGESAVENSGAENVASYTVPDGITDVVVTIYTSAQNVEIKLTHNTLIDVDGLKDDVDGLKDDVEEHLLSRFGYFNGTTLQYWDQTAQIIVYYPCKPNTTYTINKNETTPTFAICYIKKEPARGTTQPVYNYVTPSSGINVEYTTGNDALYVLMLVGQYTGDVTVLKNKMSATSKQLLFKDDEARTIITYDEAYLPKHIYMIVNKDYEIYHSQICPKAKNYTFKWNSGDNYGNRVRLKYDSTGNKSLVCNIYNADGTLAKQLFATVHVVDATTESIHLLPFGDSLTNHCVWESELMNMAENIVCVGSRSRAVKDSDGETRTVYDEGRAGFTSFNYTGGSPYANNLSDSGGDESPHNRWYDPTAEKFSAEYYFTNNFPSGQTTPNMMTIFLGMNDLLGTHTVDEIVANMKSIIDDVLSYNSNMLIVLMTPQLRYLPSLNGHEHLMFLEYAEKMEKVASDYAKIVFLPLPIGMDSVNNYNMKTVTINTRNTTTEETASDVTHPASSGYWQIADYVLGAISYIASNISGN